MNFLKNKPFHFMLALIFTCAIAQTIHADCMEYSKKDGNIPLMAEQIKIAMASATNILKERWAFKYLKCSKVNPSVCEFNISLDRNMMSWDCSAEIKPDGYGSDSLGHTFSKVSIRNCVSNKSSIRMHSFFRIVIDNICIAGIRV